VVIFHLVVQDAWGAVTGPYAPPSLVAEGFVHCSTAAQVEHVAAERFAGRDDLLVLTIDPSLLTTEVKWEDSHADGERFPHVYGPIHPEAIVAVAPFAPGRHGSQRP
jgi:uncharacterized protein (DUF952 family)